MLIISKSGMSVHAWFTGHHEKQTNNNYNAEVRRIFYVVVINAMQLIGFTGQELNNY